MPPMPLRRSVPAIRGNDRPRSRVPSLVPTALIRRTACTALAAACLLGPAAEWTIAQPSGRPPVGPLERVEPKRIGFRYEVRILEDPLRVNRSRVPGSLPSPIDPGTSHPLRVDSGPIVVPLALQGAFHRIDHETLSPRLVIGGAEQTLAADQTRLERDHAFGQHHAVIELRDVQANRKTNDLRFWIEGETIAWSSRLDDEAAAQIPWPREWPDDVVSALRPQVGIESDDELFRTTVERITEGSVRSLPPYLAAKELVRFCIANVRVDRNFEIRGRAGASNGYEVTSATFAAREGTGSETDLVLVCVATLRAAGIPARPVFGFAEDTREGRTRKGLVSWAEFWLPDAGWVPFDPARMRGYAIPNLDRDRAWPYFGTIKDLNERVALSHVLQPAGHEIAQYPALWGWRPEPSGPDFPINDLQFVLSRLGPARDVE